MVKYFNVYGKCLLSIRFTTLNISIDTVSATLENLFKMAVYLHAIQFVLINNQNFPKAMDQLQKDLCGGGECEDHSLHENAPSPPQKKTVSHFLFFTKTISS